MTDVYGWAFCLAGAGYCGGAGSVGSYFHDNPELTLEEAVARLPPTVFTNESGSAGSRDAESLDRLVDRLLLDVRSCPFGEELGHVALMDVQATSSLNTSAPHLPTTLRGEMRK